MCVPATGLARRHIDCDPRRLASTLGVGWTRNDEILCWRLRNANRLIVALVSAFFGLLGITGRLATFLLGSPLSDPASSTSLDPIVNIGFGLAGIVTAALALAATQECWTARDIRPR